MGLEQFEQRQADSETPKVLCDAGILSAADNRILADGRDALKLPAGFPDVSASDQGSHSSPQPSGAERPDQNYHAPPADPALPGLPPPSRGHRQIVHLTPKRYIDIPYPEDFSIRNGVTYGHVAIPVPAWVPGAHPYRNR
jgi:hypothetical protein